jgi:hypothetical protein
VAREGDFETRHNTELGGSEKDRQLIFFGFTTEGELHNNGRICGASSATGPTMEMFMLNRSGEGAGLASEKFQATKTAAPSRQHFANPPPLGAHSGQGWGKITQE